MGRGGGGAHSPLDVAAEAAELPVQAHEAVPEDVEAPECSRWLFGSEHRELVPAQLEDSGQQAQKLGHRQQGHLAVARPQAAKLPGRDGGQAGPGWGRTRCGRHPAAWRSWVLPPRSRPLTREERCSREWTVDSAAEAVRPFYRGQCRPARPRARPQASGRRSRTRAGRAPPRCAARSQRLLMPPWSPTLRPGLGGHLRQGEDWGPGVQSSPRWEGEGASIHPGPRHCTCACRGGGGRPLLSCSTWAVGPWHTAGPLIPTVWRVAGCCQSLSRSLFPAFFALDPTLRFSSAQPFIALVPPRIRFLVQIPGSSHHFSMKPL